MSGSTSRTSQRRGGLAAVEARARPSFQSPIARARGTTWAYPGFGRDPELGQAPIPSATTGGGERDDRRAQPGGSSGAIMSGGGNSYGNDGGSGGFDLQADMRANPALYADPALAAYIARGLAALGLDGSSISVNRTDPNVLEYTTPAVTDRLMGFSAGTSEAAGVSGLPGDLEAQQAQDAAFDDYTAAPEPVAPTDPGNGIGGEVSWGDPSDQAVQDKFSTEPESVQDVSSFGGTYTGGGEQAENTTGGGQDKSSTSSDVSESSPQGGGDYGGADPGNGGFGDGGYGGMDGGYGSNGADGWQRGGYTGAGADGVVQPNQPAGTVHEGEVVIPAHQVQQHGLGPLMQLAGPGAKMGASGGGLAAVQSGGGGGGNGMIQPFQSPTSGPPSPPGVPGAPRPEDSARSVPSFQTPTSGPPTPPGAGMGADMGSAPMMPMSGGAGPMSGSMPMGGMGGVGDMMGALAMGGMGEVPIEDEIAATASDAEVPSFQSSADQAMAGFEDDSEAGEYEMAGGEEDYDDEDDASLGPYRDVAKGVDPFKAPDPSRGTTGSQAMQNLAALPPDAQQAVLTVLGANPMLSSALLQVLGPTFQGLITAAMKAGAPPMAQPGMEPPPGGGGLGMIG